MLTPKNALPYVRQFTLGILWTFIDSVGSQSLVIIYHLLYRSFQGAQEHGALGCLLSLVYLASALTNVGLDKTLAPFLESISASKKRLTFFTGALFFPQCFLIAGISFFAYHFFSMLTPKIPLLSSLAPVLTPTVIVYCLLTFFLESIRKTVRTFLQLSFYFRFTAAVELLGISANVLCLLFLHARGYLSLLSAWQTLAVISFTQVMLLLGGAASLYKSAPETDEEPFSQGGVMWRIAKTRLFSWVLQSLNQLYSGNFLVPVCALQFGIASASLMKVITSISYWIKLIASKVFGVTSNALLAHLKSRSPDTQTQAFHYLSGIFNQALYGLLIFLVINGKKIAYQQIQGTPQVGWSLLYFMLILTFIESFFILYEKWYILEEDAATYLGFSVASMGGLYLLVPLLTSPVAMLLTIICIRIVTFISLSVFSFYRWKIVPSFKPHLKTIIASLVLSGICFVLL